MIDEYRYKSFLELAKTKEKISWSEIEKFFGEGFIDTEDFDIILYKLDKYGIKVINDSFSNINNANMIFESYIDFENPEMISRREEIGGKKELNPNKSFKNYLVEAYLDMNYNLDDISRIYGISLEILKDWIFAYENNYESIVPHGYFTSSNSDLRLLFELYNYNSYKNYSNVNINPFFINFSYEIPENIRSRFNELFKNKNKSEEEIAKTLKIYPSLVKELKSELKNNNVKDYFYKKALKKIPMWAQNPSQYNHRIIRAYFKAYHRFDEPPTKEMIREICNTDATCYVDNFQATYSSLKADGPTTNGKLFIDDGIYVQIWDELEDTLLKYEKYFYNEN